MKNNLSDLFDQIKDIKNQEKIESTTLNDLLSPKEITLSSDNPEGRMNELEEKRKQLENTDKAQDIKLKKNTAKLLFGLLVAENAAAYVLVFLSGFEVIKISEVALNILFSATLAQTAYMVKIIISYLFPNKK